jgi:hypothetical protein
MRRPQVVQVKRRPHSGQIFQFSLTSVPQAGQTRPPSGVSQAGQTLHALFTASPQAGHCNVVWFA